MLRMKKERNSTFVWLIKIFNLSVTHVQSPDEGFPGICNLYNAAFSTAKGAGRGLLAKNLEWKYEEDILN